MRRNGAMFGTMRAWLAALAAAAVLTLAPAGARAADKIVLKDGRTLEGTIVREVDGSVWFKHTENGQEKTDFFMPDAITSLERDAKTDPVPAPAPSPDTPAAPAAPADATPAPADPGDKAPKPEAAPSMPPKAPGVIRGAVITLGEAGEKDMVGVYMTAKALEDAIPLLKADQVDVVVFVVNSGGGYLFEIQKISDVIEYKYKPEFSTVAWIRSAISAAAMSSLCIEDIYMMPNGNFGACTGWYGALQAVKDRELEEVLYMMEKISARGKKDPKIMRSMQIMDPLSASIDPNGDVHWYQDETGGEYVVNPKGQILTFNAEQAAKFKFSRGTAATLDELAALMGYQEIEWVGQKKAGFDWPVSRAEKMEMDFRAKTHTDEQNARRYQIEYRSAVAAAQAEQDKKDRAKFVNRARAALAQMESAVKNNPNFARHVFGMSTERFKDWVAEQRELLKKLMK